QNFIGPFGAIFASVFYLLIGAASYFLAAVLLGFGAAKLFYPRLRVVARYQNFIGRFGAIFASVFYLLIGAASYFLAAVLLGFGAAKLFYPRLRVVARLPWIILFIVSGACLLQLQTRYFFDWKKLNIQGPGGSIGYFFGKKLLLTAMGDVGSMILLAGIYLSALILMTGLRPIHLVRESVGGIRNSLARFREWRLHREMRRADIKGQL